jgi:hypothetical protein
VSVMDRALDRAAEPWMHRHLERCYWLWEHGNQTWFDGLLSVPFIELAVPREADSRPGHAFADIGPGDEHGTRLVVRIHPELLRGQDPDWSRAVDSYLLHEAVHADQVEVLGWPWDPDNDWHGRAFQSKLAEVERAHALDLTVTRRSTWR